MHHLVDETLKKNSELTIEPKIKDLPPFFQIKLEAHQGGYSIPAYHQSPFKEDLTCFQPGSQYA